mmetsp:Transcript_6434/g.8614  ORF Transcript_6434/g.8614 Transcript_6434/m.8614 type:complete len:122 (+) Transcript_6434:2602-2967(+)
MNDMYVSDLSRLNDMKMNLYSIDENFKQVSNDDFYVPAEVNGEAGINRVTGEKVDATKALYEYEVPEDAILQLDPYGVLKSLDQGTLDQTYTAPLPVLVAEGLRTVYSIDTKDNNEVFMEI